MQGLKISAVGCSLMDFLFTNINFSAPAFKKYSSRLPGDGGMTPGHLVFLSELEKFSGLKFSKILSELAGNEPKPDACNIGGPAVVALINAAQLLFDKNITLDFHAVAGDDWIGDKLFEILSKTPLCTKNYRRLPNASTPSTFVLSDASANEGKGERTFVNDIGSSGLLRPEDLGNDFFDADILLFGATALVPGIHDALSELIRRGVQNDCVNVVSTVFDFRNEAANPAGRWPLGKNIETFKEIDLLIMDHYEALRISGENSLSAALDFYIRNGVSSFIITNGAKSVTVYSDGRLFSKCSVRELPVSAAVIETLEREPSRKGDTTGCGDNFAGGVLASLASQMLNGAKGKLDIIEATALGVASGGFACFCIGGTYIEKNPGEKAALVKYYYSEYMKQIKAPGR